MSQVHQTNVSTYLCKGLPRFITNEYKMASKKNMKSVFPLNHLEKGLKMNFQLACLIVSLTGALTSPLEERGEP